MSAGFDPSLTGRENVSLRGNILGFKSKTLQNYIDQVREFADIDDFFDSPVQFYSSGMKSRLGFAASSSIEPDILIIDEVLAVGDLNFRLKCYDRINQLAKKCAVIFVSHSIGQISKMCTRAIYLEKGKMLHDGDVKTALSIYQDTIDASARKKISATLNPELLSFIVEVNNSPLIPDSTSKIFYGDNLSILMDISKFDTTKQLRVLLRDASGAVIQDWNSKRSDLHWATQMKSVKANLGPIELAPGTYKIFIEVNSIDGSEGICLSEEVTFRVYGEYYHAVPIQRTAEWRFV
jgi:lipopolysaccharide transport system ATP-binding protein